jgi:hypothetical protein
MVRIALVLATLGVLASCTGTPMEGQGLGPLNGSAADLPTQGSAGVNPSSVIDEKAQAPG